MTKATRTSCPTTNAKAASVSRRDQLLAAATDLRNQVTNATEWADTILAAVHDDGEADIDVELEQMVFTTLELSRATLAMSYAAKRLA